MEVVPRSLTDVVQWSVVTVEIALGLSLLAARAVNWTGVLAICLLGVFTMTLGVYRLRGNKELVCGCFADFERKSSVFFLMSRNVLLSAFALPLVLTTHAGLPDWKSLHWALVSFTLVGLGLMWKCLVQTGEVFAMRRQESVAKN